MKKLLLVVIPMALVMAHLFRVQLVAAPPSRSTDHAEKSSTNTEANEPKSGAESADQYRLAEDEVFKRVGPAYPKEHPVSDRAVVPLKLANGDSFQGGGNIYIEDEGQRQLSKSVAGGEGVALHQLLNAVAGIYPVEMAGEAKLWIQKVHGDFVVRKGSPPEDIVKDVERMLNNEMHIPAQLEYQDVERIVYVLQGEFKPAPIGPPWRKKPDLFTYVIYGKTLPRNLPGLNGAGPFEIFLKAVGTRVGRPVIADKVKLSDGVLGWSVVYDDPEKTNWNTFPQHLARNPEDVLRHVSEQIGYTFHKEKRTVRILTLEQRQK